MGRSAGIRDDLYPVLSGIEFRSVHETERPENIPFNCMDHGSAAADPARTEGDHLN